jgi:hypothetical protein
MGREHPQRFPGCCVPQAQLAVVAVLLCLGIMNMSARVAWTEMEDGVRITVIATGFGQDAIAEEIYADRHRMNYRRDAAFERGPRAGAGLATAEPVNLPNPHLLKERWERAQGHDKLEVPAFLRRQMD